MTTTFMTSPRGLELKQYRWRSMKLPEFVPDTPINRELIEHIDARNPKLLLQLRMDPAHLRSDAIIDAAFEGFWGVAVQLIEAKKGVERIRKHIAESIQSCPLEMFPFPHMKLTDVFPADVYPRILALNPFLKSEGRGWFEEPHPYAQRRQFNFPEDIASSELAATLPDEHKRFWQAMYRVLLTDNFLPEQMYQKFPAYFDLRYGNLMTEPDRWSAFKPWMFLQKHNPGFGLGPHTGIPTRVFNVIFNFPEDDDQPELGTVLYAPRNKFDRCSGRKHLAAEAFKEIGQMPFLRNSALVYFKTPAAFHGVDSRDVFNSNGRFSGQIQFFENGQYDDFYGCGGSYQHGKSILNDLSLPPKEA